MRARAFARRRRATAVERMAFVGRAISRAALPMRANMGLPRVCTLAVGKRPASHVPPRYVGPHVLAVDDIAFRAGRTFESWAVFGRNLPDLEPVREMALSLSTGSAGRSLTAQHPDDAQKHPTGPLTDGISLRIWLFWLAHTSLFVIDYK